jgi:hypothetical protein
MRNYSQGSGNSRTLPRIGSEKGQFGDFHNGMLVAMRKMTASKVSIWRRRRTYGKYSRYYFERKVEWKNE